MQIRLGAALAAVMLAGCATAPLPAGMQYELTAPLVCAGERQCKIGWQAAQAWVASHAGMKLQIANDTVIETYNSTPSSPNLSVQVIRQPLGEGRDQFTIRAGCANLFGCVPDRLGAVVNFKREVRKAMGLPPVATPDAPAPAAPVPPAGVLPS